MSDAVELHLRAPCAHLVMAQGHTGNRMDQATLSSMSQAIDAAEAQGCRVLLVRSRGEDFCLGMNMQENLQDPAVAEVLVRVLDRLRLAPLLTVAFVRGRAQGGGVGLAAACDLVIADKGATFLLPELCWGFIPAVIMPTLLRRMTPGKAASMSLSLRALSAEQAQADGLVDEVGDRGAVLRQLKQALRLRPETVAAFKSYIPRLLAAAPGERAAIALDTYARSVGIEEVRHAARELEGSGQAPAWFAKYPASELDTDL